METDLSEGVVRAFGLQSGLVDVKVCEVVGSYSGLEFVRSMKDRCYRALWRSAINFPAMLDPNAALPEGRVTRLSTAPSHFPV